MAGRRSRVGAEVAVAIDADGNTGQPIQIKSTAVDLDWGHASIQLESLYADAAEKAAQVATFTVSPEYKDTIVRGCLIVNYRLQSD